MNRYMVSKKDMLNALLLEYKDVAGDTNPAATKIVIAMYVLATDFAPVLDEVRAVGIEAYNKRVALNNDAKREVAG